jgi:hypothetical protein
MRIVLYSVTMALLGALAVQASLARERVGHRRTAHSVHTSSPNAPRVGRPAAEAGQVHAGEKETRETPMTVWRRSAGSHTGAREEQNLRIVPMAHPPVPAIAAASNIAHRNAIGVQVTSGDVTQRYNVQPFAHPPIKPGSVPASGMGVVAAGNPGGMRGMTLNGSSNFATFSRGTIGSPTPTHLGTPQPGIGGPPRVAAGINGSTFRPKR